MSLRTLESLICAEARRVLVNPKLRVKDIAEWSSGKSTPQVGEIVVYLPVNKVNVCIEATHDKRPKTKVTMHTEGGK